MITNQIMITFQQILDHSPCVDGWAKLLLAKAVITQHTHDKWVEHDCYEMDDIELPDEPFPISDILETNGLDDTIWALRCIDDQSLVRKFAVWCAYQVERLMTDQRSKDVMRVAWLYSEGRATKKELSAALVAARTISAARTVSAALVASDAARTVSASSDVAWVVSDVAWIASDVAWVVRVAQKQKLKEILDTGQCPCPWEE